MSLPENTRLLISAINIRHDYGSSARSPYGTIVKTLVPDEGFIFSIALCEKLLEIHGRATYVHGNVCTVTNQDIAKRGQSSGSGLRLSFLTVTNLLPGNRINDTLPTSFPDTQRQNRVVLNRNEKYSAYPVKISCADMTL